MIRHRKIWLSDFSAVEPETLHRARYALQWLALAAKARRSRRRTVKSELDDAWLSILWPLLSPLMTADSVQEFLTITDEDEGFWEIDVEQGWAEEPLSDPSVYPGLRARLSECFSTIPAWLRTQVQRADQAPLAPTVKVLRDSLDLDLPAVTVLDWLYQVRALESLRTLLRETSDADSRTNHQRLAIVLGLSEETLREALQREAPLRALGLIDLNLIGPSDLEDFLTASPLLEEILGNQPETVEALLGLVIEPAPPSVLALDAFAHMANDVERLTTVLQHAVQNRTVGINALFYGPPGTGKTELAHSLIHALGFQAWQVRNASDEDQGLSGEARLSAYLLAQRLLGRRSDAVLIFDEIEDVFPNTDNFWTAILGGARTGKQKGWKNRILENNAVPALWLSNTVDGMDPAFIRRFLLPVPFLTPPRSVRRRMVDYHLGDGRVPDAVLDELAADAVLAPAQYAAARRLLDHQPLADPATTVRHGVAALRNVLHGSRQPRRRRTGTAFDLMFLNLGGQDQPPAILQALQRHGEGSLCLYGLPGTGKTAFAEALAEALDRELIARSAADVLSKYVGETEKNLAQLFQDHDPAQSILFLDEADSFLSDRQQATRTWERTQVNELLQQMEAYPGIFVTATNAIEAIDRAALRRFDFKLEFRALNINQRRALLARETLGDPQAPLPELVRQALEKMNALTPGDFATVKRQERMLDERFTPEQFLRRLFQEQHQKTNTDRAQLGSRW